MSELTPLTPGSFLKLDDTACHARLRRLAAEHAQNTPVSADAPEALARAWWDSQEFVCRQSERLALQELYGKAFTEAYADAHQHASDVGNSAATEPLPTQTDEPDAPRLSPSPPPETPPPASATPPAAENLSAPALETPPHRTSSRFEDCAVTLTLQLLPARQETRPVILSAGAQGRIFSIVTVTVPVSAEIWPALAETAAGLLRTARQQLGRLETEQLKRALAQTPARPVTAKSPVTSESQTNQASVTVSAPASPIPRKQPGLFG